MAWGSVDLDVMNTKAKELEGDRFFYTIPDSGDKVFFCPPWSVSRKIPFREITMHYKIGTEKLACLKNYNLPCPICDASSELFNLKDNELAQKTAKEIYKKNNFMYNVLGSLNISPAKVQGQVNEIYYAGPQGSNPRIKPYICGKKLHQQITTIFGMNGNIFDPMQGNLIILTKMKNARDETFVETFAQAHPAKCKLQDNLLALLNEGLPDLDKLLPPISEAQAKALADIKLSAFRTTTVTVPAIQAQQAQIPSQTNFVQQPFAPVIPSSSVPQQFNQISQTVMQTPPPPVNIQQQVAPQTVPQAQVGDLNALEAFVKSKNMQQGK